jgi:hypothetical protein
MAFSVLKSNDFVPEEVETLKEIAKLKEAVKTCEDDEEKAVLIGKLNAKTLSLTLLLERYKRKR